jgi:nucleolar protein 14
VLVTVIETLREYVNTYEGLSSFPEMFLPISMLLFEVAQQENIPYVLQDKFKDAAQLIKTKAEEHYMLRRPLQMRKQKPQPIKLLNPKFEEK